MSLRENSSALYVLAERFEEAKGADVASATTITLGGDGNTFVITGATTIAGIVTSGWQAGSSVVLRLPSGITVTHNSGAPGAGAAAILMSTAANLTTAAVTPLILIYDGTNWIGAVAATSAGISPAPVDATYITQIPNATLTNEQALSLLATGVMQSTTATGVVTTFAAGTDRIPYGNGSSLLTDSANLTYNTTDSLHIKGTNGSGHTIILDSTTPFGGLQSIVKSGTGDLYIGTLGAQDIHFYTATNERIVLYHNNDIVIGSGLATNAASGWLYGSSSAGVPTGVPTSYVAGAVIPYQIDRTNYRQYFYMNSVWMPLAQFTGGLATGLLKSTTTTGLWTIGAAGTDFQAPITWPLATRVLFSTGTTTDPGGDGFFTFDSANHLLAAGNGVSINGVSLPTNSLLTAENVNNGNRDRVQFYVGGGATQDTPDNTLFMVFPQATTIPAGRTTGIWSTQRIYGYTLTGASSPTITEAASLYIDAAPTISGATATPYAIHVAAGKTQLDGAVGVNGGIVATNSALTVAHSTESNRDRVQLFVGGGALNDASDNSLFIVSPAGSSVVAGTTTGIYATARVKNLTWTGASSPTITEAASVYIDGAPTLSGITGPSYALHAAAGGVAFGDLSAGGIVNAAATTGKLSVVPRLLSTLAYYTEAVLTGNAAYLPTSSQTLTTNNAEYVPGNDVVASVVMTINLLSNTLTGGTATIKVVSSTLAATLASHTYNPGDPAGVTTVTGATGSASAVDTYGLFVDELTAVAVGALVFSVTVSLYG